MPGAPRLFAHGCANFAQPLFHASQRLPGWLKAFVNISGIVHIVLTVQDIGATVNFYESVPGMTKDVFGEGRVGLKFGNQKINLHEFGNEFDPKAMVPKPGSEDLCLVTESRLEAAMVHVRGVGVEILEGPVRRTGAVGPMVSFYFRDPDGNLIEVASYEGLS